jgi:hypothetical protein
MAMITRLVLFCDSPDIMRSGFCPRGQSIIVGLSIWDMSLQHRLCSRDMAKGDELTFRLNILTNLKFIFGVASLSYVAAITGLVGLGMANIAGKFITVNIVGEEFRFTRCGFWMAV